FETFGTRITRSKAPREARGRMRTRARQTERLRHDPGGSVDAVSTGSRPSAELIESARGAASFFAYLRYSSVALPLELGGGSSASRAGFRAAAAFGSGAAR